MNYFGSIFAMVACIVMSAYFSATETAFSSLNKTRLKVLADNGNKRAALALKLSQDYDKLISTILIGNNIVNIMVASIGTLLFVGLYGDIGATISTVVVTIIVLIYVLMGMLTGNMLFHGNNNKDYGYIFSSFTEQQVFTLGTIAFMFFALVNWVLAFFRFKESEIIQRM